MSVNKQTAEKDKWWKSKTMRIMVVSIVIGAVICAATFTFIGIFMNYSSVSTINDIGEVYMSGMGEQVALRYNSVIEQRMQMVEALRDTVTEESTAVVTGEDDRRPIWLDNLEYNAKARGFICLGLYRDDYENGDVHDFESVYGGQIVITDPAPFKASLNAGQSKVAVGDCGGYQNIILISVPTDETNAYTMTDGKKSKALAAGITNELLGEMLALGGGEASSFNSHIIREEGSYVLDEDKSGSGHVHVHDNFYDEIIDDFGMEKTEAEKCVAELRQNMSENKPYSKIADTANGRRHMYCARLESSEWYLVTVMDYNKLDGIVGHLSGMWVWLIVCGVVVMGFVLGGIFFVYYKLSHQTIEQLNEARKTAIEANKAKSEFLSNMSHDIRTPMNAIVGMTAIATSNIDNKQQVQNCLKKIALSSKHLLGLINDVLDMSKIESGKMTMNMERISIREVMDGIATIVQPQLKIKNQNFDMIIRDIQTENIYCDSVRLNQVFLNLLSNAIKFTPEGGDISVSLSQEDSPRGENYVRCNLKVKDTGIGMTPEFKTKIFDSFTREDSARVHKTEGTGLGMSITKYIVDAMHGTITVESELGKGTEFHVTVDLEKAQMPEDEMSLPNWKMLVVDDDELLCRATVESLNEIGVRGEWTLSGEDAVEKVVASHESGEEYNIILVDWKLPGIDGIETARQLAKRLGENIPILLMSAYDWSDMEEDARAAGIKGFISKPLFKSTLFYGLKKFIGGEEGDTAEKETSESKHDLNGIRVLLAEDNDLNWEIAEALLAESGITADRAENGRICVDMLKNSEPGTYAAVLMDIRMPVMTGYEATEHIRKLDHADKNLPIIAMTADAFADDMQKCISCGMNAHIAKPIDIQIVKATLAKFISR